MSALWDYLKNNLVQKKQLNSIVVVRMRLGLEKETQVLLED
jgi:hypothetical protein